MARYAHVMECLGRVPVRVVWEDGEVRAEARGEPIIEECPLMRSREGFERLTPEAAERHVLRKARELGMFTPERRLRSCRRYTPFGVSETLMVCLRYGLVNAAVVVSDCLGTVVTDRPSVVQGLGGEVSGIVETDPIPEVVERAERLGCTVLERIDQAEGVETALEEFEPPVAVTVVDPDEAVRIREGFGRDVLIAAVHTSGLDERGADRLVRACDIVTGCPSEAVKGACERAYLVKSGRSIPVYGVTPMGAEALLLNARELSGEEPVRILRGRG